MGGRRVGPGLLNCVTLGILWSALNRQVCEVCAIICQFYDWC